jgi:hypothetical protein
MGSPFLYLDGFNRIPPHAEVVAREEFDPSMDFMAIIKKCGVFPDRRVVGR